MAGSLLLHPALGWVWDATRDPRPPRLVVEVKHEGKGRGLVQSNAGGLRCTGSKDSTEKCIVEFQRGERVVLTATVGEKSTFKGWTGACGDQAWRAWNVGFEAIYGERQPEPGEPGRELYEQVLLLSAAPPPPEFPLQCEVNLAHTEKVLAEFGEQPDEVAVEWVAMGDVETDRPEAEDITLPDPDAEAANVTRMDAPARKPEDKAPEVAPMPMPEVAQVEPPPPTPVPPPPAAPQPPPPEVKKKVEVEAPRMKAVEVPDENNVVEKAPDDAHFLSDKNRDVAEETHAKETNLEREQRGKSAASEKSDVRSDEIGGEEEEIAQLEESEATSLEAEREEETVKNGESKVAKGIETGDEGEGGQAGQDGDGKESKKPGMLSMRGIEGRGAPGGPVVERREIEGASGGKTGDGGKKGLSGKKGRRGIKTELEFEDYERIVGKDVSAAEQKTVARRSKSIRRGRWEQKLSAIKSSLENFTPEVRPGNQTALKTRAAPFAVYIARMHRRIHELWGFGFLEDLDEKPSTHEMNDWSLWTKIEIVINPDGTVDKVNIARPSGVLAFDVAALDTMLSSGPYEAPPDAIRSADGKTYVHWAFHRDWRQCGTFGAEPYILTSPPKGGQRDRGLSDGDVFGRTGKNKKTAAAGGHADDHGHAAAGDEPARNEEADAAARARAASSVASPDDPRATHAANLWLSGFTHADIAKMLKVSGIPFHAGGGLVAQSSSEVSNVYRNVLKETGGRVIREWRVLSAAGYRKALGALPDGANSAPGDLFMVVKLKGEQFTLLLREHAATGEYKIVGFYR
ncbi:MAG TPA: hypothetical protein VMZ28_06095 [Kofleriaceae bacterium]|nr:hypothetical protein [Kofleriaceae bacterium]